MIPHAAYDYPYYWVILDPKSKPVLLWSHGQMTLKIPRYKGITCDTPSDASDHLYQIWKESIKNCRCYRMDTIFKAKAKWPWRYRQGQRSLYATHPLILVIICAKYRKNPLRTVDFFVQGQGRNFFKKLPKILISRFWKNITCNTPSNDSNHLCYIQKESIQNCRHYRADTIF